MVKAKFQEYLPSKPNAWTYSCFHCRAHLARHEDLISKSFQGSEGRAYLFNQVINVDYSEAKQRVLLTGIHFVADVFCSCCKAMLGWRYERALEPSQRYKEGKVIVELAHLIKDNCWDMDWLSPRHFSSAIAASSTSLHQSCASSQSKELPYSPLASATIPMSRSPWPPIHSTSSPPSSTSVSPRPFTCSTVPISAWSSSDKQNQLLPSAISFNSLTCSSSPANSCGGVPYPLDRHTLSPGPSSCGSSCYGRTPDQEVCCVNQLIPPNCDLFTGTAAHGTRVDSQTQSESTPPMGATATATNWTTTSCSKSRTPPFEDTVVDKQRRPKSRPQPLNLRLAFGGAVTGVSNPIGHKHRVRLRTAFTTRRASSSSPSRAILLPLTSDDESDESSEGPNNRGITCPSGDERASGDAFHSTPHTLTRSGNTASLMTEGKC